MEESIIVIGYEKTLYYFVGVREGVKLVKEKKEERVLENVESLSR